MTEQAHDRPKVGPTQQPMAPCDLPVPRRSRRPAWTKFIDEPIEVHQRADETSRTPNKACYWIASAMIDGEQFIARSRYGAVNELARQLVAAGIPDAPMFVYTAGLRGFATIPSFHRAANWTYEESAGVPLHRIPYARRAAARERARSIGVEAPKQGVSGPGGSPTAADLSVPEKLDHPIAPTASSIQRSLSSSSEGTEMAIRATDRQKVQSKRMRASPSDDRRQGDLFAEQGGATI